MRSSPYLSALLLATLAGCDSGGPSPLSPQSASPQGPSATVAVSDGDFAEVVLRSPLPVLVDFHATWCGPCRRMEPTVEQLARQFEGRVVVAKLDVDQAPEAAAQYDVASIPTFILFRSGRPVDRIVGMATAQSLAAMMNDAL